MAAAFELLGLQDIIAELLHDPGRLSAELPRMSGELRTKVRKALEDHPELICESYGFGEERVLHVFKKSFGEDSQGLSFGQRTIPMMIAPPSEQDKALEGAKNVFHCVMDGPVCKLDLASVLSSLECSTIAPSSCPSDRSPASTFREMVSTAPRFLLPPGLALEVHNTFIHFKTSPSPGDQRAIQSMPSSMFRQCLLAESSSMETKEVSDAKDLHTEDDVVKSGSYRPATAPPNEAVVAGEHCAPPAGSQVMIQGLSRFPAFNGLRGTLGPLDEQDGRYNIVLSSPACGRKTAKVKRKNFRVVAATENLDLFAKPRPLKLSSLV